MKHVAALLLVRVCLCMCSLHRTVHCCCSPPLLLLLLQPAVNVMRAIVLYMQRVCQGSSAWTMCVRHAGHFPQAIPPSHAHTGSARWQRRPLRGRCEEHPQLRWVCVLQRVWWCGVLMGALTHLCDGFPVPLLLPQGRTLLIVFSRVHAHVTHWARLPAWPRHKSTVREAGSNTGDPMLTRPCTGALCCLALTHLAHGLHSLSQGTGLHWCMLHALLQPTACGCKAWSCMQAYVESTRCLSLH